MSGVLLGGLAAGGLDIAYAMLAAIQRGRSPIRAVQAVASGLLGRSAFEGGWATFALGLVFHFCIAIGAASVYYLVSRHVRLLRERVLLPGVVFGVLVYLFMNFVVLPLSAVPFKLSYTPGVLAIGFVSHALLVGLPIALAVRGTWQRTGTQAATRIQRMSPARPIRLAVRGLLAGLAAGVLLGVSGRAAMALLAVAGGNRPRFSWGGSFEVVLLGVAIGAPAALVFAFVHRLLPGGAVVKGLIFGLGLFGVVAAAGLPAARSAFAGTPPELRRLVPPLFAAPFALYGLVLGSLIQPRAATELEPK